MHGGTQLGFLPPPHGALWAVDGAGPAESDQVLRGPAAGLGGRRLSAVGLYVSKYL